MVARQMRPALHGSRRVALLGLFVLAGCATATGEVADPTTTASPGALHVAITPTPPSMSPPAAPATAAVPVPDRVRKSAPSDVKALGARLAADVLVVGKRTLPTDEVRRLTDLSPAGGAVAYRSGTVSVGGRRMSVVGVDPSTFRAFTAAGTAEATAVWQSVARGEVVASHSAAKALGLALGKDVLLVPTGAGGGTTVRLGALATTGIPGSDLVVDDATANALGLPPATAMLLTAGKGVDPVKLAGEVRTVTGTTAEVDLLSAPAANPVAFLTGSKAAKAFGAFSYKYYADGTIEPDARWVQDNIRTETVPIMGRVTCHRLMLPQLRGALQDVVSAGLSTDLRTYNGCYVPRFIESNPRNSISLHTWGIAIDMDAASNYRGIRGTMNPEVVKIFKRWGFRWGGDWRYTDPMHFELGAVLDTRVG